MTTGQEMVCAYDGEPHKVLDPVRHPDATVFGYPEQAVVGAGIKGAIRGVHPQAVDMTERRRRLPVTRTRPADGHHHTHPQQDQSGRHYPNQGPPPPRS
jgi:hypothetical protein